MKNTLQFLMLTLCLAAFGCSGGDEPAAQEKTAAQGDHVWKDTTDTLERAEAVEAQMLEAAQAREEEIKKQTQ